MRYHLYNIDLNEAYSTPGGIFRTESRFRRSRYEVAAHSVYSTDTQSSFFDLIGGKHEAEFFATESLK